MITPLPFVEELVNFPDIPVGKDYKLWYYTKHTYPCQGYNTFRLKDPRFDIGVAWRQGKHEIDYYMDQVRRFCGFTGDNPGQYVAVDETYSFEKRLPTIGLCNGSYGHLSPSKVWGGFSRLADTLKRCYSCEVVKLGYQGELADVATYDHDFVGKLTMPQTAAVIKKCDVLVTTDTCLMHVGDALQVPMVVLWGGSILSKNRPVNGKASVLHRGLPCQPCHDPDRFQNCAGYKCLASIDTGDVMREIRKVLGD
jgi:ADP-heptose:LPS heptosyltransferase